MSIVVLIKTHALVKDVRSEAAASNEVTETPSRLVRFDGPAVRFSRKIQ
jgi:hypothetical protein